MLENIFESMVKSLENENWLVLIGVVIFSLLINLKSIIDLYDRSKNRKEDSLKSDFQLEAISELTKSFVKEKLDMIAFERATGISADKSLRRKIQELHDKANGELSIFQLSRASKYFKLDKDKLIVNISGWSCVEAWFNRIVAFVVFTYALLVFFLLPMMPGLNLSQIAGLWLIIGMLSTFGTFLLIQTTAYSTAKNIQPIIEKLQITTNDIKTVEGKAEGTTPQITKTPEVRTGR